MYAECTTTHMTDWLHMRHRLVMLNTWARSLDKASWTGLASLDKANRKIIKQNSGARVIYHQVYMLACWTLEKDLDHIELQQAGLLYRI